MNKSDKLKSIILSKYKSLREFSSAVGIPNTTLVSALDRGIEGMAIEKVIQICDFLHIDIKTFEPIQEKADFSLTHTQKNLITKYEALDAHGKEIVDVVIEKEIERMEKLSETEQPTDEIDDNIIYITHSGYKASAGRGYFLFDDAESEQLAVTYNELTRKADICISVDGHSMEPLCSDNDILLVRKQPDIEVGEIGIFIIGADKGYVKEKGPDRLISLNDKFDDIYPNDFEEIICYGKVLGKLDPEWIK